MIDLKFSHRDVVRAILLFAALPAVLVLWGSHADVEMPVYGRPFIGYTVSAFGIIFSLLGAGELLFKGKGLPIRVNTSVRFIDTGAYAILPHPIYTGFCVAVWGISMAVGSAAGLWLITPTVVLGCMALVYGYERPYLRKTFPTQARPSRVSLPRLYSFVIEAVDYKINNWRELHIGPIRVLSHGIYSGLGAMVGILMLSLLTPYATWDVIIALLTFIVIGGFSFAQFVEDRNGMIRPFGYFGALIGSVLGLASMPSVNAFEVFAAMTVAAPFAQSIGRVKCLIQGCCHGHICADNIGIHYNTPLSTAVKAGLNGIAIHPTQLYSIAFNLLIGIFALTQWIVGSSAANIVGVYLILAGCARFVEEAYRGEPGTYTAMGLRIYQWFSVGLIVLGATTTCLRSPYIQYKLQLPEFSALLVAIFAIPVFWIVSGVDMPKATSRYSRLG